MERPPPAISVPGGRRFVSVSSRFTRKPPSPASTSRPPGSVASGSRTASPRTAGPGSGTGAVGMRRGRPRLRLRCPRQLQEPFTALCAGSVLGLLRPAGGRPGPPSQWHSDRPNRKSQRPETPRLACGPPRSPGRAGRREKLCQGGPQARGEEQRSPGGRPAGAGGGRAPWRGVREQRVDAGLGPVPSALPGRPGSQELCPLP